MDEDSRPVPLVRRAPGGSGSPRPPAGVAPPVLPLSVQRVARAAVEAAREQERTAAAGEQEQPASGREAAGREQGPAPAGGHKPVAAGDGEASDGEASSLWFPVDPESDTQPIAAIVLPAAGGTPARPAPERQAPAEPEAFARPAPRRAAPPITPSAAAPQPVSGPLVRPAPRPEPDRHTEPDRRTGPDRHTGPRRDREFGAGPAAPSRRYRLAGALASAVLLAAAGSLSFALWRSASEGPSGKTLSAAASATAQAVRGQAAAWISSQVSRSAVVSCDPQMCQALRAHGVPATSLLMLPLDATSSSGAGLLGAVIVVATPTVRTEYGGSLNSAYAPAVLASFGSGGGRIDIRLVASKGAAAYRSAAGADQRARQASGLALLRSSLVVAPRGARTELTGGLVDSRLLVTLANLAALEPLTITSFGGSAPGAGPGIPLRSVVLSMSGHGAGRTARAYLRSMTGYLDGLHGLYRPARIQTVHPAGGAAGLRIEFTAPSPLGLFAPSGSARAGVSVLHTG